MIEATRHYKCLECGHTQPDELNETTRPCDKCGADDMMGGPPVENEMTSTVKEHIEYLAKKGHEAMAIKEFIQRDFGAVVYYIGHAGFGYGEGGGWPLSVEMVGGERFRVSKQIQLIFKED